ncbi:CBR-SEC-10 protein, partial [Aphelenchoides avenae]
ACASVTKYVKRAVDRVRDSVDGKNLSAVLEELGTRMYTVVLGHIRSFSYNTAGAMLLLCDINAYKKSVEKWGVPEVRRKFESLHALANLLVVVPENLSEAAASPLLADIDRSLIQNFIQLRQDYKSAKFFS